MNTTKTLSSFYQGNVFFRFANSSYGGGGRMKVSMGGEDGLCRSKWIVGVN